MSIVRWQPFREMDDLFRQYAPLFGRSQLNGEGEWSPAANITESEKEYLIKADLPEVKKEDVKITLENDVITISGERKNVKEHKDENEIRVESLYGSFTRSFSLPKNVDAKGIRAETKDGTLRVHIPKAEAAQQKTVAIEVK